MYRVWVMWPNTGERQEMDLYFRPLAEYIVRMEIALGRAAGMVFHPELAN